jgi:DNA (cytosine-5)-methyltransferase 1
MKGEKIMKIRIRKLSPLECFRLQGAKDEDFERAKAIGISDSQLYKIAGNALCTNCIQFIMEHLYKSIYDDGYETTDEKMEKLGYGTSST